MSKSARVFQSAPYAIFEDTLNKLTMLHKLTMLPSDLVEALGYSRNIHHGWKAKGLMPATAAMLCKNMIDAANNSVQEKLNYKIGVFRITTEEQETTVRYLLDALKIELKPNVE